MTIPLLPERTTHLRLTTQLKARTAAGIARLLVKLPPAKLARTLRVISRGSRPAGYDQALTARDAVCSVSVRCAGLGCLQRSVAVVVMCRMSGKTPEWCTGFKTQPFAAHAWVEVDGVPVGEPESLSVFKTILAVRHGEVARP